MRILFAVTCMWLRSKTYDFASYYLSGAGEEPALNHETPDGGMEDRLSPTDFLLGLIKCK